MADDRTRKAMDQEPDAGDAIDLLSEDHERVRQLFLQYEEAGDDGSERKEEIAEQVFAELEVHAAIEEEIFYPAVRSAVGEDGKKVVAEALEEHRLVKQLVGELRQLDMDDERFAAKFKVLMENVEHHAEEEETELFPEAEDALEDRLMELGARMRSRKEQLRGRGLEEAAA
jgi:hemerythrin superfamily protein